MYEKLFYRRTHELVVMYVLRVYQYYYYYLLRMFVFPHSTFYACVRAI